jgi:class 3 adenylate cyclase/streptogramin lyase
MTGLAGGQLVAGVWRSLSAESDTVDDRPQPAASTTFALAFRSGEGQTVRMSDRVGGRILAAILFTDIIGSTEIATKLGDARWRALLARHHTVVRRQLKRFGGKEIDTAGDGFFATFTSPAAGVRCACSISENVRELGIEVRAGLHFGEIEHDPSKPTGIAVVTASRIMGLAGPGEVLVSSTVEELIAGSGIRFEDRGMTPLKGVAGDKRIFAVRSLDGSRMGTVLDTKTANERLGLIEPVPRIKRRRVLLGAIAALAGLVGLAGVVLALVLERGPTSTARTQSTLAPNQVVNVDPVTGKVLMRIRGIRYQFGSIPAVAFGEGGVWAFDENGVAHVDPETGDVREIALQGAGADIAVGGLGVWVTDRGGVLSRIDPATNLIVRRIGEVNAGLERIAAGDGSVWVTSSGQGSLRRVDAATNRIITTIADLGSPTDVAFGAGSVWVLDNLGGDLLRIDPDLNEVVGRVSVPGLSEPDRMAVDGNGVWIMNFYQGTVTLIDPTDLSVRNTVRVGNYPTDIKACLGAVWVANAGDRTISRIDPVTTAVEALDVNGPAAALVGDPATGTLWLQLVRPSQLLPD